MLRQIKSTSSVEAAAHGYTVSRDRFHSFACALAGCAYMLRQQKNARIIAGATVAAVLAGAMLGVDLMGWTVLILAITIVWIAEFFNAAVEAAVNISAPDFHPMAKVAKDVAAGAVLLSVVSAVAIGVLVLGPPLLAKISPGLVFG